MRLSSKYAIAASIAAVAIAVPTALYLSSIDDYQRHFGVEVSNTNNNIKGAKSERQIASNEPASRKVNAKVTEEAGEIAPAGKREKRKDDEFKISGRMQPITPPDPSRLSKLGRLYKNPGGGGQAEPSAGLGAVGGRGGGGNSIAIVDGVPRTSGSRAVASKPAALAARSPTVATIPLSSYHPSAGLGAVGGATYPVDRITREPRQYRDKFEAVTSNPIKQVSTEPVSTFSIDVDTASYAFVRRALLDGRLPPKNAVRVEELINYFSYDYDKPDSANVPFKIEVNIIPPPWSAVNKLVHISIQGHDLKASERPNANLVFLIDVSGSMRPQDKLPLVKNALRMLVEELKPDDSIGIVTYASGTGVALEPTKLTQKSKILAVIDSLGAGGSTAGARGIEDAYRLAQANYDSEGVNRIILATDGDFNVGITDKEQLKGFIERKRKAGIYLSILGVGQGNYNDALMQTLAQNGNGTAAYIDTLNEARKVLVDEASSTLFTIAKDVKIQVEFNPKRVRSYRLIGYETRALKREDFNNDRVDAGDVGSGHAVTAIYEVTPVDAPAHIDDLRYAKAKPETVAAIDSDGEFGFLKLRYKLPGEDKSNLLTHAISPTSERASLSAAPGDVRFATAVAAFGQILRGEPHLNDFTFGDVATLAKTARGDDPFGYRAEFINLVRLAKSARP